MLASRIRHRVEGQRPSSNSTVTVLSGSYNLVHIIHFPDDVKYVVRVPASGWGGKFNAAAKRAFISEALTMRFIAENTQIPIPAVYDFDTSEQDEIGAPYIAMSFISRHTVASTWFDDGGSTSREERRGRTLDTVGQAVSQLEQLRFDQIGCLEFEQDGQAKVGPCFSLLEDESGDDDSAKHLEVNAAGPFQCSSAYLNQKSRCTACEDGRDPMKVGLGSEMVISRAISYLPTPRNGRETFPLSIPDFDSQNIMIDEQGNVTGIVDWDGVQTEPEFFGPCRYPGWITRDWDPLMYGYPFIAKEDSPQLLCRYRRRYHAQMQRLRRCNNMDLTLKSHIFEAVVIAAASDTCRPEIAVKLVRHALRIDYPDRRDLVQGSRSDETTRLNSPYCFIYDLGNGEVTRKELRHFKKRLKAMMAVGRTKRY